ncbi:SET domain protein [Fistulina hepatica ATCC 64428]|uniref:SET domain protein n=1 Tax=Fistulina hepatica ATCC 64428 TaxID=1128425 RepID=A0A0D7A662_9AGAR|nr:SET domain protein [Fistulina hepatica ATCC 64428]
MEDFSETESMSAFKAWFSKNGGYFHPHLRFIPSPWGVTTVAKNDIPESSVVARCPFELVITARSAKRAVSAALGLSGVIEGWSERQLICVYLCMHKFIPPDSDSAVHLRHRHYINILPRPDMLRTSIQYMESELKLLQGTNVYNETLIRKAQWDTEWLTCLAEVKRVYTTWGAAFSRCVHIDVSIFPSREDYYAAATYLSSRAFGSNLLAVGTHKSNQDISPAPILIPGIDSIDHKRGEPVTWLVDAPAASSTSLHNSQTSTPPGISIRTERAHSAGDPVYNNYGAKPNAELLLAYGFSIPDNPEDTILLRVGGDVQRAESREWVVGRDAAGADGLWGYVLNIVHVAGTADDAVSDAESTFDDILDAAEMLQNMVRSHMKRLPSIPVEPTNVRPDVAVMLRDYIKGQHDILSALLQFAKAKEMQGLVMAREAGIEYVDESGEEAL